MRNWRQQKATTRSRNWHGYIMVEGINDWYVRLAEDPNSPTAQVVLNVVDRDGEPDVAMAHSMRQVIVADRMLARVPTQAEYDYLIAMRKERGYGEGYPIR